MSSLVRNAVAEFVGTFIFAFAVVGAVNSGSPLTPLAIGAFALGIFLVYMLVVGRRAFRAGQTGDLTEYEAGTPRLVAG